METYKLYIEDRSYSKWIIYETSNFQVVDLIIDPAKSKLFSNDIFSIDDSGNAKLIHSTIQSGPPMSGVLIIDGNKTYGRQPTKNGNNGKLLYKKTKVKAPLNKDYLTKMLDDYFKDNVYKIN